MLVFAHGLEGSPNGSKIQALRAARITVIAPDCRSLPLAQRIEILDQITAPLTARGEKILLVGSSYGGLAVAWLATQHPERFSGLLLCAPALHYSEPPVADAALLVAPATIPTRIIHGIQDDIVPIDASRAYQKRSGSHVELLEVTDGHRLAGSHAQIIMLARELLSSTE